MKRGAGEILLTSIDRDGARIGYDLELTRAVAERWTCRSSPRAARATRSTSRAALHEGKADAALVAGILHDGVTTVGAIKTLLAARAASSVRSAS